MPVITWDINVRLGGHSAHQVLTQFPGGTWKCGETRLIWKNTSQDLILEQHMFKLLSVKVAY